MKAVSALFAFLVGCTGYVGATQPPINIEPPQVTVGANYRGWPTFLLNVQRSDSAQVRDIYINDVGATAKQGAPFPEGTTMVMDLFAAQKDAAGTLLTNEDGTLLKGDLLKIYVMEKQTGWGQFAESDLQNGDWMYAGYASDGHTQLTDSVSTCFACHLPLGESKDWVQRYDEYFQTRMGSSSAGPASP